mgnify:CR=1 FL=1
MNVDGIMNCPKDLCSEKVVVDGILRVKGFIETEVLEGNGIVTVEKNLKAHKVEIDGILSVRENIDCEQFEANGVIKANKINADNILIKGMVNIKTALNCDAFNLVYFKKSKIKDIEGTNIKICSKKNYHRPLIVETITADEIDIENVHCDTVTGNHVIIRKGCKIENLSYISSVDIDKAAIVKNVKQEWWL